VNSEAVAAALPDTNVEAVAAVDPTADALTKTSNPILDSAVLSGDNALLLSDEVDIVESAKGDPLLANFLEKNKKRSKLCPDSDDESDSDDDEEVEEDKVEEPAIEWDGAFVGDKPEEREEDSDDEDRSQRRDRREDRRRIRDRSEERCKVKGDRRRFIEDYF